MIKARGREFSFIDAHCHVWKEFHGQRGGCTPVEKIGGGRVRQDGEESQFLLPSFEDYTVKIEVLEGYMEWLGIERALILQNPCYGDQREYVRDIVKKNPKKFRTFGMLDPRNIDTLAAEMDTLLDDYGCIGFKIEVPDVPFIMDDPKYDFMWRKVVDRDVIIAIDLGFGTGPYDFNIERLRNVVKKYPTMNLMLPHLGVSMLWDENQKYPFPELQKTLSLLDINKDHLYIDTSAIASIEEKVGGEYPFYRGQEILRAVKEFCGMDRIMWGSDFPGVLRRCTYKQSVEYITNHCHFLTDDDLEKILAKNALRFIWREN